MRVTFVSFAVLIPLLLAAPAPASPRSGPVELGTALNSTGFGSGDSSYRDAVGRYGAVTAESAMKLAELQPAQGQYSFADADAMVDWARSRGQQVHGHTLTWCADQYLPQWLLSRSWTRAELVGVMEDHIAKVMEHFRGRVTTWDVVNEAFDADGSRRDCLWQRVIGPDWVELALRAARVADPSADLFYNETRADIPNAKFTAMEAMAQDFVARGVPLDGIGLQYHLLGHGPLQFLAEDAMRRIGALGLRVHVSELDGITSAFPGTPAQKLDQQAQAFQTVASACQAVDACFRITLWGAADQWSWRGPGEMAVALDAAYQEKPGWTGIHEEIRTPAPSLQQPPSAPGRPAAGTAVNAGVFGVGWALALDPESDPISYALEHRDADDAGWTRVATGIRSTAFSFAAGRLERQGTYHYRVRASDGRAIGAWSPDSDGVVVDRTDPAPPTLTPDRALAYAGGGGWYRDGVVIGFGAAGDPALPDGSPGSGADPASVPPAQAFGTTGSHTASGLVRDRAGNASRTGSATVQVDATPPQASLACPAPVTVGEAAVATWTAGDAGSGLAGAAAGELALATQAAGSFTASYDAGDQVGHVTAATCTYEVRPAAEPSATVSLEPSATPSAEPSPTPVTFVAAVVPPAPSVRIGGRRRVASDGRVRLTVTCIGAPQPCSGRLALRADPSSRYAAVRRLGTLGTKAFRAGAGGRAIVVIRLSRRERAQLERRGRLAVRVTVRLAGGAGPARRGLTLRAPRG